MSSNRLRVLTISELFPDPGRPAFGIFVAKQVEHLQDATEQVVLVPSRVFPPLRVFRELKRIPSRLRDWYREMSQLPARANAYGARVIYCRYTSTPRQLIHGSWGFFAYAALRRTLTALHREHRFELIHAHYAVPSGVIALLAKRWMRVPVVLSVHGTDLTFTIKQDPLSAAIVRWVFGSADAILANSTWTAEQIIEQGGAREKVHLVHLGASPPSGLRATTRPDEAPVRLLSVGYLEARKGHAVVLMALAKLRSQGYAFRYTVVGNGPELERLHAMAADLGIADRVSFEGYKAHPDVWPYFADSDIFVLPSWLEAFGVVYIEALSLGIPVIGCERQGLEDLNRFGECLELVKPRDVDSLVAVLRRLTDNPARGRRLGEVGRQIVHDHFSWKVNSEQTLAAYRRVLGRERP